MGKYVSKKSIIKRNKSFEGEGLEEEIIRRLEGQEVELGTKTLGYTLREDGVVAMTNIRSDKFELAQEAHDYVSRSIIAKGKNFTVTKNEEGDSSTGEVTAGK